MLSTFTSKENLSRLLLPIPLILSTFITYSSFSISFSHLARIYAPRISHFDLYAEAYTPKRTKYNAYIVFTLVGAFALYEVIFKLWLGNLLIIFSSHLEFLLPKRTPKLPELNPEHNQSVINLWIFSLQKW